LSAWAPDMQYRGRRVLQRERILRAMVGVVAERGYGDASVELVLAEAGVSRRTFYACFANREECFRELLDLASARTLDLVATAFTRDATWQDGLRSALVSVLAFLDSEPLLARVLLVESPAAGAWALERRARNLAELRALVLAQWPVLEASGSSPLAAEGALASVLGVIQTHILTGRPGPLIELLGPLTGLVVAQYLPPRLVAREVQRGEQLVRASPPAHLRDMPSSVAIPPLLSNPNAHRARRCVLFLADRPHASNREIAAASGVAHASQISTLLARLLADGLLAKRSEGVGKRNAWQLTARGEETVRALRAAEDGPIVLGARRLDP
jgi:AcrR family transcriptional regulator